MTSVSEESETARISQHSTYCCKENNSQSSFNYEIETVARSVTDERFTNKTSASSCECAVLEKVPTDSPTGCQTHFIYRCQKCKMEKITNSYLQEIDCRCLSDCVTKEPSTAGTLSQFPDSLTSNEPFSNYNSDSILPSSNFSLPQNHYFSNGYDFSPTSLHAISNSHRNKAKNHRRQESYNWEKNKFICHSIARRNAILLAKRHCYKPKAVFNRRNVSDNFYSALFAMIFCCFPLGLASLIYSCKVRAYRADGDHEMAQQSSLIGRKLANTGIMLGMLALACGLFYFIIYINIPYISVEYSYYLPEYYN